MPPVAITLASPSITSTPRAGQFLDDRMTRHVIRMSMTRQENFDVREFEPQLLDFAPDDGHRSLEARIDQNMTIGRGDEISREPF